MKLLQITDAQYVNLETATIVTPSDRCERGAIRFYFPAVEMPDDGCYKVEADIRIETAMMNEVDMVVWVQPDHPKFKAIHDWLTANSF